MWCIIFTHIPTPQPSLHMDRHDNTRLFSPTGYTPLHHPHSDIHTSPLGDQLPESLVSAGWKRFNFWSMDLNSALELYNYPRWSRGLSPIFYWRGLPACLLAPLHIFLIGIEAAHILHSNVWVVIAGISLARRVACFIEIVKQENHNGRCHLQHYPTHQSASTSFPLKDTWIAWNVVSRVSCRT